MTSDLSSYVPYTGANSGVDLGGNNLNVNAINIGSNDAPTRKLDIHNASADQWVKLHDDSLYIPFTDFVGSTVAGDISELSTNGGLLYRGFSTAEHAIIFEGLSGTTGELTYPPIAFKACKSNGGSGKTLPVDNDLCFQFSAGNENNVILMNFYGNGNVLIGGKIANYNALPSEDFGVPLIVNGVHLTNQYADITTTNLTNADVAGNYEIDWYLQDTFADVMAGTITLTLSWTDDAGATTKTDTLVLSVLGRTYGHIPISLASGNITYEVAIAGNYGDALYKLDLIVKRVT